MTINREKLAEMINEELAEFFEEISDCKLCAFKSENCIKGFNCKNVYLQWLNQKYKEQ